MEQLNKLLTEHYQNIYILFRNFTTSEKNIFLSSDLKDGFTKFCKQNGLNDLLEENAFSELMFFSQEAVWKDNWFYFACRPEIGRWTFIRIHTENLVARKIDVTEYLSFKEYLITEKENPWLLEVDFGPFEKNFSKLHETHSIGRGEKFINKRLASDLFQEIGKGNNRFLNFLRMHEHEGTQLLLSQEIQNFDNLRATLRRAQEYLKHQERHKQWKDVSEKLESLGLRVGWGRTVEQISKNLHLLSDVLEAPEPEQVREFLSAIPMIFHVVSFSVHGFFGQDKVLGRPDTGGQVVYILNQVRALEKEMEKRIFEQGLDFQPKILVVTRLIPNAQGTNCNQRYEKIAGTHNAAILRVPFRNENGEILQDWISRFEIWPHLEQFALDAEKEIVLELGRHPDLLMGNYSDGNLVASLLSRRWGVTQCNIAHALEKSKYLLSALYWKENESKYHFSSQFTADVLSMNWADFIITSTYQEIAGKEDSVGQYEGYAFFSMPNLYRVKNGINIFDPKFNIVSPGSDPDIYFPYYESKKRINGLREEIEFMLFSTEQEDFRGTYTQKNKPILFTMARLDHIKNITGLVEWFGENKKLQEHANLLVITAHMKEEQADNQEEQALIRKMHELMDVHNLDSSMRWLGRTLDTRFSGELYRYLADKQSVFVQPALFEAFGLTVIEAMISGLPTFATRYGGPLEIIEDNVSGFHIDPNHGKINSEKILNFLKDCKKQSTLWKEVSDAGIQRVQEHYTWELHARRLMDLARIYGFWKYVTNEEKEEAKEYLKMFYALQYIPLSKTIRPS